MSIKINELVIQIKVHQEDKPVEDGKNLPANFLLGTTEQEKLVLAKDLLHLLEDREAR